MIFYKGTRNDVTRTATVNVEVRLKDNGKLTRLYRLAPRTRLRNHSPTGFEWGYSGSGPAQLALAICVHHLKDQAAALEVYQDFKRKVIARLWGDTFVLSEDDVREAIAKIVAKEAS
jgi:uncharacterized protein DUF6166